METKLTRWCDGILEAGWLAAVIVTPLFFNIHSDRVFEPDKLTLLRSIALVMAAAWLVKFVDQKGWQQWPRLRWRHEQSIWRLPFVLPVFLLVVVYLLSNLFSVTPAISWAGSYQRLQGTYTTLSYIIIFFVTMSTMRTRAQVRRLVTFVIISSVPVAFYGVLQHFGLDPLPWAGNTQERVAGHMGNAIFIAAYLIMAVPLTLSRIVASFTNILNDDELATADVVRSSIYIFALAIQLITIYWSGSRGPWLGLFVGAFAFVLVLLVALRNASQEKRRFSPWEAGKALLLVAAGTAVPYTLILLLVNALTASGRAPSLAGAMGPFVAFVTAVGVVVVLIFIMIAAQRGWRWLWLSWILLAVFLGGWLVAFNLPTDVTEPYVETPLVGDVVTELAEWRDLPRIGRLGRVLEADAGTGRVRTLIWEGVLDLIEPHEPLRFPDGEADTFNVLRPLIGYGPESMYVAYNRFYPSELATIEARNASPDRSHNETFDALVITGWLGLLVWQFLYISVFYYGFRWLGVLRSKFDRNLMVGLWIGVGVLTAVGFTLWRGLEYIGVALPFGSIAGLVLYLIYYALFAESPDEEVQPFAADRLLMVALVAGVLMHYVEIHFGIAIASTRTHFFLYVAAMFVLGYLLPQLRGVTDGVGVVNQEPSTANSNRRGRQRGRRRVSSWPQWTGPVFLSTWMMVLVVGILGFEFTNYLQPPNKQLESVADLPVSEIFHQSFFVDAGNNFVDSPFIFVMIILTWLLGTLLLVSEMVKDGELSFTISRRTLPDNRRLSVTAVFLLLAVAGLGLRFVAPMPVDAGATWLLGRSTAMMWGFLCLLAGMTVWLKLEMARWLAGSVALLGVVGSIPVMIAGGGLFGVVTAVLSAGLLWAVWDGQWSSSMLPAGIIGAVSLGVGLFYTYFHAFLLRNSLFFRPAGPVETAEQLLNFRVEEASQAANFLTAFYWFAFIVILLSGTSYALMQQKQPRQSGSLGAYGTLLVLLILTPILITNTNLQVVQADMIYKRGRFYDSQAANSGSAEAWDTAIAVYEKAIELAPREDFYYLFLGRAYLERSAVTTDPVEQVALLNEAQARLLEAQQINPLNTDHTANLARLNLRWVALSDDDAQRRTRVATAEEYYQDALALSPQNSIIRNEYARLAYDLKRDCDQAIDLFTRSIEIDPFYEETYFNLADLYTRCAQEVPVEERDAYFSQAVEAIEQGIRQDADNTRVWLRAARLFEQMAQWEQALEAYDRVRELDPLGQVVETWNLDFRQAELYLEQGDRDQAQTLARQALAAAPPEAASQIQLFLSQFEGAGGQTLDENLALVGVTPGERPLAAVDPPDRNNYFDAYPPFIINPENEYEAIFTTEKGVMRFRLFPQAAPLTVNNFVYLAEQGFYDGTTFHRVLEDFMAQGGDPTGQGSGMPGYTFSNEVSGNLTFDRRGLLAMANAGPDTNGSQFFITFRPVPALNGQYTIFGELIAGDEVLSAITLRDPEASPDFRGDVIERIEIVEVVGEG